MKNSVKKKSIQHYSMEILNESNYDSMWRGVLKSVVLNEHKKTTTKKNNDGNNKNSATTGRVGKM